MSGILTARSQEKFIKPIQNYTDEQSTDKVEYITGQNTNGKKRAIDAVIYGLYPVSTNNAIEAGSTKRVLKKTAHGARKNDVIQFENGLNQGSSAQILSCPNADTMIISCEFEELIAVGDLFSIKRYITPQYDSDGSLAVNTTVPPIQYNIKSAGVTTTTTVLDDQDTPSSTKPLPVSIRDINGAGITINAGDLTVSVDHINDSVKIGDGTRLVAVTTSNELKTADATAQTTLSSLLTELQGKADPGEIQLVEETDAIASGTITTQNLSLTGTATANSAVEVDTQGKSVLTIQTVGTYTGILGVQVTNDEVNWLTTTQAIVKRHTTGAFGAGVLNSGAQDVYKINVAGFKKARVSMTNSMTGSVVATLVASKGEDMISSPVLENTLTNMSAKLPSSVGAKTSALSLSVVPATDATFTTKPKALTNTYDEKLAFTTIQTFTAPADAIGGKIMASDTNTTNVRYKQNGTATTTSGMQLQGGRSEDFTGGSNITVIPESGTCSVFVQWTIQS